MLVRRNVAAALHNGKVFNALDACKHLGVDASGLDAKWQKAKKDDQLVKFGGGFYCGKVNPESLGLRV
jgi:hypothetical protein